MQSTTEYFIRRLNASNELTEDDVEAINTLAKILSPKSDRRITHHDIDLVLRPDVTVIVLARETASGRIIGMASLVISAQLLWGKAWLEDVAVLDDFQGHGVGKMLTIAIVLWAQIRRVTKLDLTSGNSRAGAQGLYINLGWEGRESRLMRLNPQNFDSTNVDLSRIELPA